ncbi:fibronectin type III domain-containing protein 4 isoform X2 [Rhea pennata]|uniref:fibronectin type III domain-containing protein 4 isoform X2 n=1 Tax=Rhea pennata TaxID=8795 RepID=UPI002E271C50
MESLLMLSPMTVSPDRPPSPVNVTVTQLKANSATVSWDVPEGDVVIGYAILQQRQDGQMQRFIREVNTTNRACVLWDLAEDADYIIQVQSIGLYGESQASKRVHFRTLKETDRLPSNSSNQGDITMEGLDKDRQLQTGEIIIIVAVLLMWAAVIALFCRQYDIIKDNDSNNNKEKTKPSSEHSTPERPTGGLLRSKDAGTRDIHAARLGRMMRPDGNRLLTGEGYATLQSGEARHTGQHRKSAFMVCCKPAVQYCNSGCRDRSHSFREEITLCQAISL